MVCCVSFLFQDIFFFPFWFLFWSIGWECFLISIHLWVFQLFSCCWFLVLYYCDQKRYLIKYVSFWICWNLYRGPTYNLSLKMSYVNLRRICILLLFSGIFCICLLGLFGLEYSKSVSLLVLCLDNLAIVDRSVKVTNYYYIALFFSFYFC